MKDECGQSSSCMRISTVCLHKLQAGFSHTALKCIAELYNSSRPKRKLQGWDSFRSTTDDGEQVVAKGVTQMGSQILNRTLSGHIGLDEETKHRKHG